MHFYLFAALFFVGNCVLSSATHTKIQELCNKECGHGGCKVTPIPDCCGGIITCRCYRHNCVDYTDRTIIAPDIYQISDGLVCMDGCKLDVLMLIYDILDPRTCEPNTCKTVIVDPHTHEELGKTTCILQDTPCRVESTSETGTCNKGVCEIGEGGEPPVDVEQGDTKGSYGKFQTQCEAECGCDSYEVNAVPDCGSGKIYCHCVGPNGEEVKSIPAPDGYQISDGIACYKKCKVGAAFMSYELLDSSYCELNKCASLIIPTDKFEIYRRRTCYLDGRSCQGNGGYGTCYNGTCIGETEGGGCCAYDK